MDIYETLRMVAFMWKRRNLWWGAGALMSVMAVLWWNSSASPGSHDVQLRFLHYTNNTDGLSTDELAVYQDARYRPPSLPPPTHAVLLLTNGSQAAVAIIHVYVTAMSSNSVGGPRLYLDSKFAGVPRMPKSLAPGEAISAELKVASSTGPWLAEAQFLRGGRVRRIVNKYRMILPGSLEKWVSAKFLSTETTAVEFGDSSPLTSATISP